ncbi:MAG TPA: histidine kinase, partial [Flavisolibacter sp.]|nr:histidine kinase [Flavisolibacter sp.]
TKDRTFYDAAFDVQQQLWIGTDDGLLHFDPQTKKATGYACRFSGTEVENASFLLPFFTRAVCPDNRGRIWLASVKYGLFSFNIATKTFTPHRQYSDKAYEVKNRCADLLLDNKGRLWIGNMAGLTMYDTAKKSFTNYSQKNGLASGYVYSIGVDKNNHIVGRGNAGVFSFAPETQTFTNHSVPVHMSSSLLEQDVSIVNSESIVGFEGGFSVYSSPKIPVASPLPVFITSLQMQNEAGLLFPAAVPQQPMELAYNQNVLQIEYACVNYSEPEGITYRYRLNNSKEWSNAGTHRSVLYTELSPGNYAFSVVAVGPDGSVSSQPATLHFTILPPFWKKGWFLLLVGGSLIFGLALLYKRRVRSLQQKQKQKLERQQLEIESYRQRLEMEQISSFFSGLLLTKRTTQDVLDNVAKDLIGRLGFDNCMIYLWDEERELLLQQGGYGLKGAIDGRPDAEKYHLRKNHGIVGATVSSGQPILLNDTSKDSRYVSADTIISQSELCVPLIGNNRVLGAINIEQAQKNFFTQHHLQIVTTIATLVASRIEAIQLTAAKHQKELELETAAHRITETELAMLRSQMNPHFIFNSLNSIQKYIWESRQEDAAEYLTKFARLIRSVLENSEAKLVPLQKELVSLKLYVELEHRRSNQKFDYCISVDEDLDVNAVMVPPLLLQPYIENAIWHGLNPKKTHGDLCISIRRRDNTLHCVVEDNGIGREASLKLKDTHHKSMGLNISLQRIQLMQKEAGIEAAVSITDKATNGEPAGTKIEIILPLTLAHA